jgi:hypothetical protein
MKFRHAAAFAVMGWYLISPPTLSNTTADVAAPLSHWQIISSFDTAIGCEHRRRTEEKRINDPKVQAELAAKTKNWNLATAQARVTASVCVASDDPRFKQN